MNNNNNQQDNKRRRNKKNNIKHKIKEKKINYIKTQFKNNLSIQMNLQYFQMVKYNYNLKKLKNNKK